MCTIHCINYWHRPTKCKFILWKISIKITFSLCMAVSFVILKWGCHWVSFLTPSWSRNYLWMQVRIKFTCWLVSLKTLEIPKYYEKKHQFSSSSRSKLWHCDIRNIITPFTSCTYTTGIFFYCRFTKPITKNESFITKKALNFNVTDIIIITKIRSQRTKPNTNGIWFVFDTMYSIFLKCGRLIWMQRISLFRSVNICWICKTSCIVKKLNTWEADKIRIITRTDWMTFTRSRTSISTILMVEEVNATFVLF